MRPPIVSIRGAYHGLQLIDKTRRIQASKLWTAIDLIGLHYKFEEAKLLYQRIHRGVWIKKPKIALHLRPKAFLRRRKEINQPGRESAYRESQRRNFKLLDMLRAQPGDYYKKVHELEAPMRICDGHHRDHLLRLLPP